MPGGQGGHQLLARKKKAVGGATDEDVRCSLLMTSIHGEHLVQFSTSFLAPHP